MATVPPPWRLTGAAVLLPDGWRGVVGLVHYATSPVGPYDELAVVRLTWRGLSVTAMWVTSEASRQSGRANWGFPKELAALSWQRRGERVIFRAGRQVWRVRPVGPALPLRLRGWTVQTLHGQSVRVPVRLAGRVRLAFAGRRLALLLELLELTVLGLESPGE